MRALPVLAMLAACGTPAPVPAAKPVPAAVTPPAPTDAPLASPELDAVSAEVAVPADEPEDDDPDTNTPVSAKGVACTFEHIDPFATDTFHGVVPWVKLGTESVPAATCCVLPSSAIFCIVTEGRWDSFPSKDGGEVRTPHNIEHARLFDKNGRAPWLDVVLTMWQPGPMNDPRAAEPPLFHARVEADATTFKIVPTNDKVCARGAVLPCDEFLVETGTCAAFRRRFANVVRNYCKGRGNFVWRKGRLVPAKKP